MRYYLPGALALVIVGLVIAHDLLVSPFDGRGPGAVAEPGVRENPASYRAVYIPYVVSHGDGSGGGYRAGK
ncbi:MAG: hypothetical protein EXR71_19070 [Myxococcales bacterium]|nr:hypothetical protein [Myxococcales bacterium]